MESHVILLKPFEEGASWRILGYAKSLREAKLAARTVKAKKLNVFDMIIAAPIEATNPAVLYESQLSIYVVDVNHKVRHGPALFKLIKIRKGGEFVNWLAAWEMSEHPRSMITMCEYIGYENTLSMACDFAVAMMKNVRFRDSDYDDIMAYIESARSGNGGIELPRSGRLGIPDFIISLKKIAYRRDWYAYLSSMIYGYHTYSNVSGSELCEIIRSHVPLPVALLGEHAIK